MQWKSESHRTYTRWTSRLACIVGARRASGRTCVPSRMVSRHARIDIILAAFLAHWVLREDVLLRDDKGLSEESL